ncbi:MAG: EF-P beta-lysylation protein EpmB [Coxiella burnetii]|nr:EF-P beta-lysylation protein EpmB [Coxiella burnetii]
MLKHDWQTQLKRAISNPIELWNELQLDPQTLPSAWRVADNFALRVPRGFVERMEKGNPNDPLLLQILPQAHELIAYPGYSSDPLNEKQSNLIPGLLHKYHGRVLITLSGACAVHCRYCFRRHFPYEQNTPGRAGWSRIFDYLKANSSINEVILSGGDPLMIKDEALMGFVSNVQAILTIKRLRIHTRLPIVIPERITAELVNLLSRTRLQTTVVIHCNHPNEINQAVIDALDSLRRSKVSLLNQSVLLKNVNDDSKTLIDLSERLFDAGVLPYYLHLLDHVTGAAHFEVSEQKAQWFLAEMIKHLPGYLVPKFVREIPGALSKTPLSIDPAACAAGSDLITQ